MHFFVKYFLMFLFFSSAGWLIESLYCSIGPVVSGKTKTFKFINRGFLTGPMTPIYGVSCMVMLATLLPFRDNVFLIFILGLIVCDVVEYITSYVMEKLFNARWWDYTGYFLNIKGRICFRNSLIWGALSALFIKGIYPGVNILFDRLLNAITWEGVIGLTFLLLGVFLVDLGRTVVASLNISKLIHRVQQFRDMVMNPGDTIMEAGEKLHNISQKVQENYVNDMRTSISQLTGWQRHRIKRLLTLYPQFSAYAKETREEIGKTNDLSTLITEFRYLRMDAEALLSNDKKEMY
ncbi:MAG: putative ABC transporter permease [Clostridia bacterium]|nr:putative ABC transporter permease [Clostridia bacterium]MBR1704600.1 putative ABC transporter permease [Clostridia bacterium]